jgi:hypothetical protein
MRIRKRIRRKKRWKKRRRKKRRGRRTQRRKMQWKHGQQMCRALHLGRNELRWVGVVAQREARERPGGLTTESRLHDWNRGRLIVAS